MKQSMVLCLVWANEGFSVPAEKIRSHSVDVRECFLSFYPWACVCCRFDDSTLSHWFICYFFPARHGDGLYDSYMRTDHILKDNADTNSPSGLPPVPKHTVSIYTNTYAQWQQSPISCAGAHSVSRHPVPQRDIPHSATFLFIPFPHCPDFYL